MKIKSKLSNDWTKKEHEIPPLVDDVQSTIKAIVEETEGLLGDGWKEPSF